MGVRGRRRQEGGGGGEGHSRMTNESGKRITATGVRVPPTDVASVRVRVRRLTEQVAVG